MSDGRRVVRTTASFFEDLDRQLDDERGSEGQPSVADFQVHELLLIVEVFATRFDSLPKMIPGRSDYRALVDAGKLVPAYLVVGQLVPDGAVELLQIDIDFNPLP